MSGGAMSARNDSKKLYDFHSVFAEELTEIEALRRRRASESTPFERGDGKPAASHGLLGLAISGGGIRSATFALGVIQALARSGVLKAADYMSTVSGGGFIGSCLSSVLNDARAQSPTDPFPLAAQTGQAEPPALVHLRNKSKYLAPGGVLDKLRIPALLVRGTLDNFAIFLFIIMLGVTATHVAYQFAWGSGFEIGVWLRRAFALFIFLPIFLPLAYASSSFLRRILFTRGVAPTSTWEQRNRAEALFGWWLALLIAILVLIPLVSLLNNTVEATWTELRTLLMDKIRRPFEAADGFKWIVPAVLLIAFMFAARASQLVSAISGKLVLLGVGILGPALLFLVYLGLIVIEIDSPIVGPKPLFTINGADVDNMAVPGALKKLKEQFAARWMPLSNVAYLHTAEPGRRWVIRDDDTAYRVTRHPGNDELAVEQDFEFLLDRDTVSPEFRDALAAKGNTVSKHPRVTSSGIPSVAEFHQATATLPLDSVCGGGEPMPVVANKTVAAATRDVSQWPGAQQKASTEDLYLWGNHTLAVVSEDNTWKLEQVVHPSLALQALDIASSPVEGWTRQPLQTLLQGNVKMRDDELEAARRFIKDSTKQQDLVIVIDRAVPSGAVADVQSVVAEALENAQRGDTYAEARKTMRVAFLEIDSARAARYTDFRSLDAADRAASGASITWQAGSWHNINVDAKLQGGSAALLCATRLLMQGGREGTEKSIMFVGTDVGPSGKQLGELDGWSTVPWSRFRFYMLDLAGDVTIAQGPTAALANKPLPGPVKSATLSSNGRYMSVGKSVNADAQFREMVGYLMTRLAANSPQRESFPLQQKYMLYREGAFVRIEAKLDAAPPKLDSSTGRMPDELRTFFATARGAKLTADAWLVPPSASENRPGLREICADPRGAGRARTCWRIEDPYLFKINRTAGGLSVVDQSKAQPWWIPANIVGVSMEPNGAAWNDASFKWPWIAVLAFLWVFWLFYNVNSTTLHRFYRDRLSKAYLIRLRRDMDGADEAIPNDSLKLSELNAAGTAPYHLINVALNLENSKAEDLRGRGADFFLFSKCFVGSPRIGFVRTTDMEKCDRRLDLGTAMAISGAAAAPSMGSTTIKPLVFIMTLLNIRLNYWLPNPRRVARRHAWHQWLSPGPLYLIREALGSLDERKPYLNVSDGGHIENLGVYELLRRRCKTIIAIDGEADPLMRFNGLMTLVRYAHIDLGIKIEFDPGGSLDSIRKKAADSLSARNWAAATISYGNNESGRLYYIKASITGGEQDYVKDYCARNPDFPHQSTADQFFDETQFEAYRALGEEIGGRFCADVVKNSASQEEFAKLQNAPDTQVDAQLARFWTTTLSRGFTST